MAEKTAVSRQELSVLKEAWMASSANGHDFGCLEDMQINEKTVRIAIDSFMRNGIVVRPLSRNKIDGRVVTQFMFTPEYKVELYEDFLKLFTVAGEAGEGKTHTVITKKEGGDTHMATATHKLSAYDKARQVLKADGIKTDQSTTKQSLMTQLMKAKDPKYKKLGEAIKAEIEAREAKKTQKKAPKTKASAKGKDKAKKAPKKAPKKPAKTAAAAPAAAAPAEATA